MKINIKLILLAAGTFLSVSSISAQDLFRVSFRASSRSLNEFNQLIETKITERNIVNQAVAARGLAAASRRNYVLVYNGTNDSLQVVNSSTGAALTDVIQFEGGAAATDDRQAARFAFMFLPNEATAFGSASISEEWPGILIGDDNDRAHIICRLQFALTGNQVLGGSNAPPVVVTNAPSTNTVPGTNIPPANTNDLAIPAPAGANGGGTEPALSPITETNSLALNSPGTNVSMPIGSTALASAAVTGQAISGGTVAISERSSPGHFVGGASVAGTNSTNVRVYTGMFTAGRRFLPNGADSLSAGATTALR